MVTHSQKNLSFQIRCLDDPPVALDAHAKQCHWTNHATDPAASRACSSPDELQFATSPANYEKKKSLTKTKRTLDHSARHGLLLAASRSVSGGSSSSTPKPTTKDAAGDPAAKEPSTPPKRDSGSGIASRSGSGSSSPSSSSSSSSSGGVGAVAKRGKQEPRAKQEPPGAKEEGRAAKRGVPAAPLDRCGKAKSPPLRPNEKAKNETEELEAMLLEGAQRFLGVL